MVATLGRAATALQARRSRLRSCEPVLCSTSA